MELIKLPVLPLRSTKRAFFPGVFGTFEIGRSMSSSAVQSSIEKHGGRIIIAFQKEQEVDKPGLSGLFPAAVEASLKKVVSLPTTGDKNRIRVSASGVKRGFLRKIQNEEESYYGSFEPIVECDVEVTPHLEELSMHIQGLAMNLDSVSFRAMSKPKNGTELSLFLDCLSYHAPIPMEEKMSLLANGDAAKRAEMLHVIMIRLVDEETERVLEMEAEPPPNTSDGTPASPGQGGGKTDPKIGEVNRLRKAIDAANMPSEAKRIADNELRKLRMMATHMSEFSVTLNYLDLLVSLPWNKLSSDSVDLEKAERVLDGNHYGLKKPKARILEYLSIRKLVPDKKGMILCFSGPPGVGKAQPLDAQVLSPDGPRTMGSLKVGDSVIAPDGKTSKILGVFPQGERDVFQVRFSDGASTECCEEHLWKVQTRDDRRYGKSRVVSLKEIMKNLFVECGKRKNYSIPSVERLDMNHPCPRVLKPYLVGILLSEGQGRTASISNGDLSILSEVKKCLEQVGCCLTSWSKYDYGIVKKSHNPADNINRQDNRSVVARFLDESGLRDCLAGDKFIPAEYLFAPFQDRHDLLQGILDGDGSPDNDSCAIEWSSASKELANGIQFLVQSLGGQARYSCGPAFYTYNGQHLQGQDRHRLRITLPSDVRPFRSSRKMKIYQSFLSGKRHLPRYIEAIEPVGKKHVQCILVDHPDHLYVTDDFIVTHNTSLGKSIARATGREFVRLSVGGLSDEAEIRGHRRTYIGAMPGKIMQNIRRVGTRNPVFMLDEVDKMGRDVRGDPQAALLEVLDPEQNSSFTDNYIGTGFDLSRVMFITTVNDISRLHPALKDRMDVVDISGYSPFDKVRIAKHYLIPKQKEENGLDGFEMTISLKALSRMIDEYTNEAGVRSLERECGNLMRKLAVQAARGKDVPTLVTGDLVRELLGPPKIFAEKKADKPDVGLSTGLAWTPQGGCILFIESVSSAGKGKVKMTGRLGEVMQESVEIVHSWIKAHASYFDIEADKIDKLDIHVHVPSGATPKDGPSAGIAIAASIISLLSGIPVRNDVAVTGEISLLGRILPVGGVREKILAAHRAGIREVLIPENNIHDVSDVPKEALDEMDIRTVDRLEAAMEILLCNMLEDADDTRGKHKTSNESPSNGGSLTEITTTQKM